MRPLPICSLTIGLALFTNSTLADGLIQRLPGDGSWVKYYTVLTGGGTETTGELILRSVGKVTEKQQPCRWIELDFRDDSNNQRTLYKVLVPEKQLQRGVDPLDYTVRAWQQEPDRQPERLDDPSVLDRHLVGAILHAPVEKPKLSAEEREFPYQDGTLKCKGESGERIVDLEGLQGTLRSTTWRHEKVPFGVAGLRVMFTGKDSDSGVQLDLAVMAFGKDAKSALPDAN